MAPDNKERLLDRQRLWVLGTHKSLYGPSIGPPTLREFEAIRIKYYKRVDQFIRRFDRAEGPKAKRRIKRFLTNWLRHPLGQGLEANRFLKREEVATQLVHELIEKHHDFGRLKRMTEVCVLEVDDPRRKPIEARPTVNYILRKKVKI